MFFVGINFYRFRNLNYFQQLIVNQYLNSLKSNFFYSVIDVKCYPIPDALNPCEDVMGSDWLRGSVWLVIFLAVFGNVAVLIVLFSNR